MNSNQVDAMKTKTTVILAALMFLAFFLAGCVVPEEARTEIAKLVKIDLTQQLAQMVIDKLLSPEQYSMIVEKLAEATATATAMAIEESARMALDWERWAELGVAMVTPYIGITAASRLRRGVSIFTGRKLAAAVGENS